MQNTRTQTIPIPAGGPTATPIAIATAPGTVPMRVQIRNVGAVLAFLGMSSGDVAGPGGPTPETYRLPAGAVDIFVIAPQQKIYSVGAAAGALLSVAMSEAIPITTTV